MADFGVEKLTISGNQGDEWHTAQVDIASKQVFYLMISGVIGQNYSSDVALDDLLLLPGEQCISKLWVQFQSNPYTGMTNIVLTVVQEKCCPSDFS